ncbi:hypothetical protein [Jeotgalibacillus soli]|uniref:Uncharacterized protein n=1 Tax=Jeotgalibacillus soli TaxID=889306 RepID=A0A0C2W7M4_9BACL|nr:hypothetical protein [Jeotgalibacillus soli]KIL52008.1 hypothetical protein KP78_03780 [Jeotgalibacillus soli]
MTEQISSEENGPAPGPRFPHLLERRGQVFPLETQPLTFVADPEGNVLFNQQQQGLLTRNRESVQLPTAFFEENEVRVEYDSDLAGTNQEYRLLIIMLVNLAALGAMVIY